jgi:hypothetical protein
MTRRFRMLAQTAGRPPPDGPAAGAAPRGGWARQPAADRAIAARSAAAHGHRAALPAGGRVLRPCDA